MVGHKTPQWSQRLTEVFKTGARIAASWRTPPSGSVADTNPFQILPSNSSAALIKALSEANRLWPSLSVLRS
jgi:hypothetical protein